MEFKISKENKNRMYHVWLLSMLITINIYFGIFVWMPSDLSPNFALLLCTFPFIIMEFKKIKFKCTQSKPNTT
jgi:hypothetical protein